MPIRVRVRYFAGLRRLIGLGEEVYTVEEGTQLRSLLLEIIPERHGEIGELGMKRLFEMEADGDPTLRGGYMILVNGRHYNEYEEGLSRILGDGDIISILETVGGG